MKNESYLKILIVCLTCLVAHRKSVTGDVIDKDGPQVIQNLVYIILDNVNKLDSQID